MKKSVLISIFLVLIVGGFVYAAIGSSNAYHPLDGLGVSGAGELDKDGNGIIDYCDSLVEPITIVDINKSEPYHSLSEFSINTTDLTPVDSDSNGWPDRCDNISTGSVIPEYGIDFFHKPSQIRRGDTNDQSIDSDSNGWPDKGDCITSELPWDENNCGSCGNDCSNPADPVCIEGNCEQPVWIRYYYSGMISSQYNLPEQGFDVLTNPTLLDTIEGYALTYCNEAPNGCSVTECNIVPYNSIIGSQGAFLDGTACSGEEYNKGTCYCGIQTTSSHGYTYYGMFCRVHQCVKESVWESGTRVLP